MIENTKKTFLFLEGKTDVNFIKSFIKFLDKNSDPEFDQEDTSAPKFKKENNEITLINCGSKNNITTYNNLKNIARNIKNGDEIILIVDANSSFESTQEALNSVTKKLKQDYSQSEIKQFIIHKNNSGYLEDLIFDAFVEDDYKKCINEFSKCIEKKEAYKTKIGKLKFYNYISLTTGKPDNYKDRKDFTIEFMEQENICTKAEIFNHENFSELKKLLEKILKETIKQ